MTWPIVGDVRGEGFFFGIELVKDKATKQTFTDSERERLLGHVSLGTVLRPDCIAAPTTAAIPSFSSLRR